MKAYNYIVYALWVILAIVAKILGASWWVALSPIWFPVGVIFVILLGLKISVDVGKILKRKKAKADPDSCENCLFGKTASYSEEGKCMGESLDEGIKRPRLCKFYRRHRG